MTTKMIIKCPVLFYDHCYSKLNVQRWKLDVRVTLLCSVALAALLIAASVRAGDLTVDNLMVNDDATFYGSASVNAPNGDISMGTFTNRPINITGGTITTFGNYRIHTFTNNGTFKVFGRSVTCDVLVVAGGGGAAARHGGGGGAGGLIYTNINISGSNAITVGAGGDGAPSGLDSVGLQSKKGINSVAFGLTAIGGGPGSGGPSQTETGGSGGGSHGGSGLAGLSGTSGQGNAGGAGIYVPSPYDYLGGGGGGAGGVGGNASSGIKGAAGVGLSKSISGLAVTYAVGGTGSSYIAATVGSAGMVNRGNGGNAGGGNWNPGGNGGSGIVIIRYVPPW